MRSVWNHQGQKQMQFLEKKKTLPKAQRPRGLSGSYTNVDQISSSEPQPSVNYVQKPNISNTLKMAKFATN